VTSLRQRQVFQIGVTETTKNAGEGKTGARRNGSGGGREKDHRERRSTYSGTGHSFGLPKRAALTPQSLIPKGGGGGGKFKNGKKENCDGRK